MRQEPIAMGIRIMFFGVLASVLAVIPSSMIPAPHRSKPMPADRAGV